MARIGFDVIVLKPEQVERNVLPGDFPEENRIHGQERPVRMNEDVYLHASYFTDVSFPGVSGGALPVSFVTDRWDSGGMLGVRLDRNEVLENQAQKYCDKKGKGHTGFIVWSADYSLEAGLKILAVYTGDYNADRRTDIFLKLSDGRGVVFQQKGETLPSFRCVSPGRSRPRP